ncbi:MAG: GTPase HflX [Candidatus Eisenbacteria bacterium]|nr:GTPase HflX [Candidatus Eisenbacteria bacterium]
MQFERNERAERAILVGLRDGRPGGGAGRRAAPGSSAAAQEHELPPLPEPESDGDATLAELELLTRTAGGRVAGRLRMRRAARHPATFLSKGKLAELQRLVTVAAAELVIFDDDLSPAQARNLQRATERKVVDRTELILDIFARRAQTREAKLQVELAQLQYLLPRLTRMWGHLSRLGGGIGTRGPGETQLEVDRRRVREKIATLKRRLGEISKEREIQSRRRQRLFRASMVGYTNAGKSTLFNALTRAGVLEEDLLFATLETTTRRLYLPRDGGAGETILLSDTVGFIRKLPHHLVASFRATLQEVRESDLLIHVVDASQPDYPAQMRAVEEVVAELVHGGAVRWMLVLNKSDRLSEEDRLALRARFPQADLLSALDPHDVQLYRGALATEIRRDRGQRLPRDREAR